ncbi:hypothetical protein CWI80_10625 [Pseudidiomarina sediminum]|uniref:Uncharacterized protein n=1 Tax=Pseudidiomarina sediminum TaxID=431675 RepID=A0A432Z338_9GAMM|nr:hypothetical protein [Pseudidiomarina sediminum]RUO72243.1 hypothetical protein CWI80_10625 [Pseudidiomarina sediminum]
MFSLHLAAIAISLGNQPQCENVTLEQFYRSAVSETRLVNENYNDYLDNLPLSSLPIDERKRLINDIYSCFLANTDRDDFKAIDSNALHNYYVLLSSAYSTTKNEGLIKTIVFILDEKRRRNERIKNLADNARELAVQARDIEAVHEIETRFNLDRYNIEFEPAEEPTEYTYYQINKNVAQPISYDFSEEDIIVVSSPYCNPSKRFIDWYKSEGRDGVLKGKRVFFLIPQDVPITSDTSMYANLEYGFSYKDELWEGIRYWATPTFYYWKDGMLLNALDGWRKGEGEEKVDKLLAPDAPKDVID